MQATRIFQALSLTFFLLAAMTFAAGCSSEERAGTASDHDSTAANFAESASDEIESADETADEKIAEDDAARIKAAFASLSPADRELAEKQQTCPVSGDPLGLMGTPVKVDLEGYPVFVCCKGCEEPLREDANAYLVQLGFKPAGS